MTSSPISVAEARERVLAAIAPVGAEIVPVEDALGRVLREDLTARSDVPPFACSAMDGYALEPGPAGRTLKIAGESRAGSPSEREPAAGEAIRVSTGAVVPATAGAVIRQEDVRERDGTIETVAAVVAGANVRRPGEDMRRGATILTAGTRLGAAELGAAVAAGAATLTVSRRPDVAIICTGDELKPPGEPLGPGEIHNSNGVMLAALTRRCGAKTGTPLLLRDDREATEAALSTALPTADVLIVSGGVSVGPHDHVKPALDALGVTERFWGVALKPGKPTWFGATAARGGTLVFGLPGNPVSAAVTFALFARPALMALQGATESARTPRARAALGVPVARNARRELAVRVRLERREAGVTAFPTGPQGSHLVSSLLGADALAMIPAGEGELAAGAIVELEPL